MASSSVFSTSMIDEGTKGVVSKGMFAAIPGGKLGVSCLIMASTPFAASSALALVASDTAIPAAGLPLKRLITP